MSVLAHLLRVAAIEPQHEAVKDSIRNLDYESLAAEAARVAAGLLSLGVRSGDRVIIRLSLSVDALAVSFGCMWVGAIFVPLSLSDPPARLTSILHDCKPAVVVRRADDDEVPQGPWSLVTFDDLNKSDAVTLNPPPEIGPAYCIYTSGTTGLPKGVVVGHESFAHATLALSERLGMGITTRTLCISPFHFDGSFASLFPTLVAGGTVIILRREPTVLPRAFVRIVRDERVDTAFCTPSFLRLLLSSQSLTGLADSVLARIVFGGEAFTARHLLELFAAHPAVRLFNLYGPTETVVAVTLHEITRDQLDNGEVPIGQPHPGVAFVLFNKDGRQVVHPEESGELYIGGAQLMEGYWDDPELSARVLRKDLVPGSVLYRSGDLAKRNAAGNYVYLGRADRVIKRTGIRISLDEIERLICQLPGVANAGCVTITDNEETRIIVYAAVQAGLTSQELLADLAKSLPRSMMPDSLTTVESIPLTAAGKVNYRDLMETYRG